MFFNKTQGTPFYTPGRRRRYRQEWLKSQARAADVAGVAEEQVNVFADIQALHGPGPRELHLAGGAAPAITSGRRGSVRSPGARR